MWDLATLDRMNADEVARRRAATAPADAVLAAADTFLTDLAYWTWPEDVVLPASLNALVLAVQAWRVHVGLSY